MMGRLGLVLASRFAYLQLEAVGATKRTEVAVATLPGEPIAYAAIAAKKARLFTSTNCRED